MEALLPSHEIVMLDESFDRASVRYALSWRHPPGALKDLPNLRAFSRSAPASITYSPIPLSQIGRSCAWSTLILPTA